MTRQLIAATTIWGWNNTPYIPAYKLKNSGQFFDLRVEGSTYMWGLKICHQLLVWLCAEWAVAGRLCLSQRQFLKLDTSSAVPTVNMTLTVPAQRRDGQDNVLIVNHHRLSQWPHCLLRQHSALFLSVWPSELTTSSVSVWPSELTRPSVSACPA